MAKITQFRHYCSLVILVFVYDFVAACACFSYGFAYLHFIHRLIDNQLEFKMNMRKFLLFGLFTSISGWNQTGQRHKVSEWKGEGVWRKSKKEFKLTMVFR